MILGTVIYFEQVLTTWFYSPISLFGTSYISTWYAYQKDIFTLATGTPHPSESDHSSQATTQQTISCSKSTQKHKEKVRTMFKVNDKDTRMLSLTSF